MNCWWASARAGARNTRGRSSGAALLRRNSQSTTRAFSQLSPLLHKGCGDGKAGHSHGLFGAHTHSGEETAAKMDLLEHNQAGSRITLVGMGANIGMSVAKGAAGVYFHSSALLADAAHSMSDILGDAVTLYTFRKSRQPADASHPFGYGRYEALGTLVVSAFLVAAGLGIGTHALEQAAHFFPDIVAAVSQSPETMGTARDIISSGAEQATSTSSSLMSHAGHSHAAHEVVDGKVVVDPRAIWFAVGSIAINEALFQATMKVGKRTKSNVLVANAWHHRSDALTSLVSVGAIGGAIMGFPVLDAVGGLVVSGMLAMSGVSMMADAIREITDSPPPGHVSDDIAHALADIVAGLPPISSVVSVQCRKSGPFVHVRARLTADGGAQASDVVEAVARVRHALRARLNFVQDIDVDIAI
ncbi:mitochondrial metal transporter [Coemansia sp. RSA 552]|nr:mitochondrial metal transporter [Coemansia sp. RSA 552]